MSTTNLNDRWSKIAAAATERTEPVPRRPEVKPAIAASKPAIAVSIDVVKKFSSKNVSGDDKKAPAAAVEKGALSQWMDVTPDMAQRWLKNNFRNRSVNDEVVKTYARDMRNGVWHQTHQGIAFNDIDELIDGQHRLLAIVRARVTVRMMVTFGLKTKIDGSDMTTMDCVDRGRKRSVADQLKIQHGYTTGTQIAQIASALAGFCHESIRRPSVDATLKIYRLFKPEMDFIIANRSKLPGLRSAGVLAGFVFALATQPQKNLWERPVAKMFTALNWSEDPKAGIEKYPAIKQLHAFLTGENASMLLASMNRGIADLTLQALWMDVVPGEVKTLAMKLEGRNYFCAANGKLVEKISALFELPKEAK
ncbi:MAG: hypothetical protein WCH99_05030 [Verrucomicrobiota bacterium]